MHAIVFDQSPETAFIKCALLEAVGLRCNWFASVKEYKSINKPCDFVCFENNGSASEALGVVNIITHNDNGGQKRPSVVVWTKPEEVILDEWCDVIDDYIILPTSAKLLQKKIKRLANANGNPPGCSCLSQEDVAYNRKFVQKMRSSLSAVKYVLDQKSARNAAFVNLALMQLNRVEKYLQKFLLYSNCYHSNQESRGWVNLRQLVEAAGGRINAGNQNGVRVDMNLKNRWFVYGRKNLIGAMVEEVLSNALRFAPAKSKINIKSAICGDKYHLSIDNQCESRWMYGGATKVSRNEVGVEKPFGIGLSAVWRIAKLHNIKTMLTKRGDGVVQCELIFPNYKANENEESVNN
jgi:hypothetical protein